MKKCKLYKIEAIYRNGNVVTDYVGFTGEVEDFARRYRKKLVLITCHDVVYRLLWTKKGLLWIAHWFAPIENNNKTSIEI